MAQLVTDNEQTDYERTDDDLMEDELTDEEWEHLRRTLEAVMNAVKVVHPGGDVPKRMAINHAWAEGPKRFPGNDFIFQLFEAMPDEIHELNEQKRVHSGSSAEVIISETIELCQQSTALIRAKVPEESHPFRHIVIYLADTVARATKEGGFLGIGGKLVSDAEKAVIDRITAVLPPE